MPIWNKSNKYGTEELNTIKAITSPTAYLIPFIKKNAKLLVIIANIRETIRQVSKYSSNGIILPLKLTMGMILNFAIFNPRVKDIETKITT